MLPVLVSAIADLATSVIKSFLPETPQDKLEAIRLSIAAQAQANELLKDQLQVNANEAQSENLFIAGWRPFVGWVCGCSFAWQFLLQPIVTYLFTIFGHHIPPLPVFDYASLNTLLMGMLGIAGLRSYDKYKRNK